MVTVFSVRKFASSLVRCAVFRKKEPRGIEIPPRMGIASPLSPAGNRCRHSARGGIDAFGDVGELFGGLG